MLNKKICDILIKLGLCEEEDIEECTNLIELIKFVDNLFINNEEYIIKEFLIALFFENKDELDNDK